MGWLCCIWWRFQSRVNTFSPKKTHLDFDELQTIFWLSCWPASERHRQLIACQTDCCRHVHNRQELGTDVWFCGLQMFLRLRQQLALKAFCLRAVLVSVINLPKVCDVWYLRNCCGKFSKFATLLRCRWGLRCTY